MKKELPNLVKDILSTRILKYGDVKKCNKFKLLNIDKVTKDFTNDMILNGGCRECNSKFLWKYKGVTLVNHLYKCFGTKYFIRAGKLNSKKAKNVPKNVEGKPF